MNLQVGVKVFLKNSEGKFLLLQRSSKYPGIEGTWDIVGGRINVGVPLLENLSREVQEETGLTISGTPKLVYAQDIIRSEDKHVVRLTYVGETSGNPQLDHESTAYRWLTLDEIRNDTNVDEFAKEVVLKGLVG
jgi:ADP-ribose pyrophosphatase YjhB (NUDIX family)